MIPENVRFPYVHDLARLLGLVEQAGQPVPESVMRAASLSDYAVGSRYPGPLESVTEQEYEQAIVIAEQVIDWAQGVIEMQWKADNGGGKTV